jgi:HlyD family secretion protein
VKKLGLVGIFLVVVVFVGLPLVRFIQDQSGGEDTVAPTPVVLGQPERRSVEETQRYPGRLSATSTVRVFPKAAGRVTRVHVGENDAVAAGDLLVSLEDEVQLLQMEQAQAAWEAAEAQSRKASQGARQEELENARASLAQSERDLTVAQTSLRRQRSLFESGSLSQAQLESAENTVASAETRVENARRSLSLLETGTRDEDVSTVRAQAQQARKQHELAQLRLDHAQIRSPVSGTVVSLLTELGNTVSPQSPVAVVVNDTLMFARFTVPERNYGRLIELEGAVEARITALAYPDMDPVTGVLTTVSRVIDPESRTFSAEASIENVTGQLRPGMYVDVSLVLARRENVVVVPPAAVVTRDGERVVFIANAESMARSVPVTTGLRGDGFIEVTSGLLGSEAIVVEGNAFLESGQRIRAIEGDS